MRDLLGQELFNYVGEDGNAVSVTSSDVNQYLRAIAGDDFSAKDFRTWEATCACALALTVERAATQSAAKVHVAAALKAVSERLGNTPAVCKKSYIHPGVIDEFLANGSLQLVSGKKCRGSGAPDPHALGIDELRVLNLVEELIGRDERKHLGELLATSVRRARRKRAA